MPERVRGDGPLNHAEDSGGVTVSKQTFRASSGVRSYDKVETSSTVSLTHIFPNCNGFGVLRQPPQHKPVEFNCIDPLDHKVVLHLATPTYFHGGIAARARELSMRPGYVSIVPAGADSTWCAGGGDVDVLHLHLAPERLSSMFHVVGKRSEAIELVPQVAVSDDRIFELGKHCIAELRRPGTPSLALMDSIALTLGTHLLRDHSADDERSTRTNHYVIAPYRLRRAIEFIEAHLNEDIGLEHIALSAGLSTYHFSRGFKHALGQPPYRYLIKRRIERAERLLVATELSLAEIALACGFTSQQHFTSTFAKIVGMAPGRFRQHRRG